MKKEDKFDSKEEKIQKGSDLEELKEEEKLKKQEEKATEDKKDLEKLKKEVEELKDKWLRTAAELENSKKRWASERQEIIKYALADLMLEILPLLDHFEKAMENMPGDRGEFEKGIEIIFKDMYNILSNYGLEKIDNIEGIDFDPFEHEAIGYEENEGVPKDKIIEVLRTGYKLKDRLLRPAIVRVSKGKKEEKPESGGGEQETMPT